MSLANSSSLLQSLRPQTIQYRKNIAAAGGTITNETLFIVDRFLVRALESSGLDTAMNQLAPCVGNNLAASQTLLYSKSIYSILTPNMNDSDFSQSTGWVTNGTNKYISTLFLPGGSSTNQGMGCYLRTAQPSNTTGRCLIGTQNSGATIVNRIAMNRGNGGSSTAGSIQGAYGDGSNNAIGSSLSEGFYNVSRTGSSTCRLFKNGVQIGSTTTMGPFTDPGFTLNVMCLNNAGVTALFLNPSSSVSGYHIDTGLSVSDSLKFYQIIQNFNQALGRAV